MLLWQHTWHTHNCLGVRFNFCHAYFTSPIHAVSDSTGKLIEVEVYIGPAKGTYFNIGDTFMHRPVSQYGGFVASWKPQQLALFPTVPLIPIRYLYRCRCLISCRCKRKCHTNFFTQTWTVAHVEYAYGNHGSAVLNMFIVTDYHRVGRLFV